ncbi:immunoglobulin domain-containing protein, partial [Staphylococcus aureus]|nr:immunoglobulin domain-containing protein [Staphylococcus aureus]
MPNSINVPEGENSKIKIFYSGDSLEDIVLDKNVTTIPQSDHFKFTIFDDYVIIFLKEAKKNDASDYTVT